MLSRTLQIFLALMAFSPILLVLSLVKLSAYFRDYNVSLIDWDRDALADVLNSMELSGSLYIIIFLLLLGLMKWVLYIIHENLTIHNIEVKSIKNSDFHINAAIMSYFLPLFKLKLDEFDSMYFWALLAVFFIFALNNRRTYNFNPVLTLIFGYRHYEVATKMEVSYVLITNRKLVNPCHVTQYIALMDYVIIEPIQNKI